jgi:hypothetical protein
MTMTYPLVNKQKFIVDFPINSMVILTIVFCMFTRVHMGNHLGIDWGCPTRTTGLLLSRLGLDLGQRPLLQCHAFNEDRQKEGCVAENEQILVCLIMFKQFKHIYS